MRLARADRSAVTDWWLTVDRTLLSLIILLAVSGIAVSLAVSPHTAIQLKLDPFFFASRHAAAVGVALLLLSGVSLLRESHIRRVSLVLVGVGFAFMIAALLQGSERNGAVRWLIIGGAVIQPSEFVKPGFIVLSAWLLTESKKRPDMPALPLAVLLLISFMALLVLQPDMGQTLIVAAVWCGLFFLSGYSMRFLPLVALVGLAGVAAAYSAMPHFAARIDKFLSGAASTQQTLVASTAFQESGWLGHGLGEGFLKLRLPDAHNDFVFAAIAEELGIAACLFLVLIYGLIVGRGFMRSFRASDAFVRIVASGLTMIFGLQAVINMAVNLNLLPAKGVTLPMISYGRSSLFASAITLGMILALTRNAAIAGYERFALRAAPSPLAGQELTL